MMKTDAEYKAKEKYVNDEKVEKANWVDYINNKKKREKPELVQLKGGRNAKANNNVVCIGQIEEKRKRKLKLQHTQKNPDA